MRIRISLVIVGLFFSGVCVAFAQPDRSGEIASLLEGLNSSSRSQRINTAKIITRSGIVDAELYEKVAGLLRAHYAESIDSTHVDEMSWLCKALGASGDSQYRGLLKEISVKALDPKLQHYAQQSLSLMEEYARRSQVLNATDAWDPELSDEENRQINMLRSDSMSLKRDAAKMAVRGIKVNQKIYGAVAEQLTHLVDQGNLDTQTIDTLSWFCKVLGGSGNPQYVSVLQGVVAKTANPKLKEYASRAIGELK